MPLSLDPDRTAAYSLASDTDKPEATRPAFICRFMTRRQHQKHREIMERAASESDDSRVFALIMEAIGIGVIDWRNFDKPFSRETIEDVLSDRELWELAWNYPIAVKLGEQSLGELRSRSRTSTTASVENAHPTTTTEPLPAA
jgi:hypothetical protein